MLEELETLNQRIAEYTSQIEKIAQAHYPEMGRLKKIKGIERLIALTFVLTVDDPHRDSTAAEMSVVTWDCVLDAVIRATLSRYDPFRNSNRAASSVAA